MIEPSTTAFKKDGVELVTYREGTNYVNPHLQFATKYADVQLTVSEAYKLIEWLKYILPYED